MAAETISVSPSNVFYSDEHFTAGFTRFPATPGHVVVNIHNTTSFVAEDGSIFLSVMLKIRHLALVLSTLSDVRRCALVFDGTNCISLIPLHGLAKDWVPVKHEALEYHETFPGFITSKSAPKRSDADLDATRNVVTAVSGLKEPLNLTFLGPDSDQSLFAQIIRGELPSWKVWEDHSNVAFLTPFGNTPGFTVLVPRKHLSSDIFSLGDEQYSDMLRAAQACARILARAFDVARCGFIFEGFEIDYAHIKLIPLHERPNDESTYHQIPRHAEFQTRYNGHVTSLQGPLLENPDSLLHVTTAMREALKTDRTTNISESPKGMVLPANDASRPS